MQKWTMSIFEFGQFGKLRPNNICSSLSLANMSSL